MLLHRLLLAVVISPLYSLSAPFYSTSRKLELRERTRSLFHHSYNAYKDHAFPMDELKPISCLGVGVDRSPGWHIDNDVFGDFSLTLVDTLDTFAILGEKDNFEKGVREIIEHVHFDKDVKVQVFEVTIRMLGGLLSSHILASSPKRGFALPWYRNELLDLAHDLGRRLLPAFKTRSGIPYSRVHLQNGIGFLDSTETCSAGAGSLLLEFATLSRLTGNPEFEEKAKKAFFAIWNRKSDLGLLGNSLMGHDGRWLITASSTGAGIDSIFEWVCRIVHVKAIEPDGGRCLTAHRYAAKTHILLGEEEYWRVWNEMYTAILTHLRAPDGFWYRPVNMFTGQMANFQVDSLSAFFPGLQTLVGDLESAIKAHAVYAFQWKRYHALPEIFDIGKRAAVSLAYPLRPEFIESNYYLYQATKDDWYLEMAEQILDDLIRKVKVECGAASLLNVEDGSKEDKMPSFFTSETLKYLFLTFDEHNPYNTDDGAMVFTTEAHMLELEDRPRPRKKRRKPSPLRDDRTCPAYDPMATKMEQHPLALSVGHRVDFEHARHLVGYEIEDEAKEIREGRWAEWGWCQLGVSEEYLVELVFSASLDAEVKTPKLDQVRPVDNGLVVHKIEGLRFGLTRVSLSSDRFQVTKIGQHKLPRGRSVFIDDPAVVNKSIATRPEKVQIRFETTPSDETPTLSSTAYLGVASSFGPSLAAPGSGFVISDTPLSLIIPLFSPFGCSFNSLTTDTSITSITDFRGKLILMHRGECSFIEKSRAAYQVGALGVVIINSPSEQEDAVTPSATPEELQHHGNDLVPVIMVSGRTGQVMEKLLMEKEQVRIGVEPRKTKETRSGGVEPVMLGGYTVVNVRIGGI